MMEFVPVFGLYKEHDPQSLQAWRIGWDEEQVPHYWFWNLYDGSDLWFAREVDCQRAIDCLTAAGITPENIHLVTDEQMKKLCYGNLFW
jgi:hypothetical protein